MLNTLWWFTQAHGIGIPINFLACLFAMKHLCDEILCVFYLFLGLSPLPCNRHFPEDLYISSRGSQPKPSFATLGVGNFDENNTNGWIYTQNDGPWKR